MSGRTETGGGVLVIEDGRGAALTDGTLGGTLGATGRCFAVLPALAGATLTGFDGGAALGVADRVVSGVFGAGATLGTERVESGGFGVEAALTAGRTLAGAGCELAFLATGRTLGSAGVTAAAAGFTAGVARGVLASGAAGFGAGFSTTGSSSSQPESMSSSEAPMPRKGTSRRAGYGRGR